MCGSEFGPAVNVTDSGLSNLDLNGTLCVLCVALRCAVLR